MSCDPSPLGSYGFLIWGPLHRGHSQSFPARGMEVASLEPWLKIKATGDNSDNSNGNVLFRLPNGKTVNSFHKTQITLSNSPIYKPISLPKCPKLKIHPKAKLWAAKRLASPAVPNWPVQTNAETKNQTGTPLWWTLSYIRRLRYKAIFCGTISLSKSVFHTKSLPIPHSNKLGTCWLAMSK